MSQTKSSKIENPTLNIKYAGFMVRFAASFLDTLFLAVPVGIVIYFLSDGAWFDWAQYQQNLTYAMQGHANNALANPPKTSVKWELLFEVSVLVVTAIFWRRWKGATPGKRMMNIHVVDEKTLGEVSNVQAVTRSLGYIVSTLSFLIGFLMVAFRKDKRGLHDMMAGTVVIYVNDNKKEDNAISN